MTDSPHTLTAAEWFVQMPEQQLHDTEILATVFGLDVTDLRMRLAEFRAMRDLLPASWELAYTRLKNELREEGLLGADKSLRPSDLPPFPLFDEKGKPILSAFLAWMRLEGKYVVPIERGTFSSPGSFELLRYEQGYYNGMARAYVRGRVESAHRIHTPPLASRDAFREEVVKGIAAQVEYHRRRSDFNPPDELCLLNVVLNTLTGKTRQHGPDVVFTWKLPVSFDPAASCPEFERFLSRVIPDEKRRELVVDLMGYCLWRRNPFQTFFVNVGDGANGKTTWLRVMEEMLGPEAIAAESLQNLSSQRFAPAELEGKLANLCDDLPFDRPLAATGVLKILTGEGEFSGERKFLPKFKFRFDGKLIANANRTPEVRDDTYAFWRRLVVIPWETTIPEEERDPLLIDKLRAELPGILNLALRGLTRCRERTEFDPDGVFAGSREEWRSRADPIRAELLDDFMEDPAGFVPNTDLYKWHVDRSRTADREPLGDRAFGLRLARVFPMSRPVRKMVAGRNVWGRPGIRRRDPSPVLDEEAGRNLLKRLDEVEKRPDPVSTPATGVSPQKDPPTSPVLAGVLLSDEDRGGLESQTSTTTPARTGDEPPLEALAVPPVPALPEAGSEDSEIMPSGPSDPVAVDEAYRAVTDVLGRRGDIPFEWERVRGWIEKQYPQAVLDAVFGRICGEGLVRRLPDGRWQLKV